MTIRISIVKDDAPIRQALEKYINRAAGFECVSAYEDPRVVLRQLPLDKPDVVLMDLQLSGMSGIECVAALRRQAPALRVIMLTVFERDEQIFESLAAGAYGHIYMSIPCAATSAAATKNSRSTAAPKPSPNSSAIDSRLTDPSFCHGQVDKLTAHVLSSLMPPRIVVDTNVFIAAILSPEGENREILRACLLGKAKPLMGAALFHEYEDLLGRSDLLRKSPLSPTEQQILFGSLLAVVEWVKVYYLWRPNLPDEADNHLIELAIAGYAEVIVTNNLNDLLHGELRFPNLKIQSPRQFLSSIP